MRLKGVFRSVAVASASVVAISLSIDTPEMDTWPRISFDNWGNSTQPAADHPSTETSLNLRQSFDVVWRTNYGYDPDFSGNTSIVHRDDRTGVFLSDPSYDAVGLISFTDDDGYSRKCTAFLANFAGYSTIGSEALLVTAGHCVVTNDGSTINGVENAVFGTEYVSKNGEKELYLSGITGPFHARDAIYERDGKIIFEDVAIGRLEEPLPEGMITAEVMPDYRAYRGEEFDCIGFSADKPLLHQQTDVAVIYEGTWLETYCDMAGGASGGPLAKHTPGEALEVIAINVSAHNITGKSVHSLITHDFLETAPFLKREIQPRSKQAEPEVCVVITASALNIRSDAGGEVIGRSHSGEKAHVLSRVGSWLVVPLDGGGVGYIHGDYTVPAPC